MEHGWCGLSIHWWLDHGFMRLIDLTFSGNKRFAIAPFFHHAKSHEVHEGYEAGAQVAQSHEGHEGAGAQVAQSHEGHEGQAEGQE